MPKGIGNKRYTGEFKQRVVETMLGINKIDELLKQPCCPFVLYVGKKKLVKRKAFEAYIEGRTTV